MKLEASGNLKRCRGKTLPVKGKPTANAQCILDKGVMKHTNHDRMVHEGLEVKGKPTANAQCILDKGVMKHTNHDRMVHEGLEYVLLYPGMLSKALKPFGSISATR